MKPARLLLITLGVVLVLALVVVGTALLPSVQRWAVLRAVDKQPDLDLALREISITPFSFRARGVVFRQDGLEVKVGSVQGDYSFWEFFVHRRINVARLEAFEVEVDAGTLDAGESGGGVAVVPAVAPGVLARAELPYEVVVGKIHVSGRAVLPGGAAGSRFPAEFAIEGGGIAPGTEGSLRLKAVVTDASPEARVRALRANMSVEVLQSNARTIDRAAITLVVDAEGPQFADQTQLRVNAEMSQSGGVERYVASIDTLLGADTDHLLTVQASLPDGGKEMTGDWSLQVRDAQIQPFFLGGVLPHFAAEGAGNFTFQPETMAVTLAGRLLTQASHLEVAAPELHAIGQVVLESEFDLSRDGDLLRFDRLRTRLEGAKPVLTFETSRPVALNLKTWRFDVGTQESAVKIAHLNLAGLPLAWIRPFVSEVDFSGEMVTGEFGIAVGDSELQVSPIKPLHIGQLTVVRGEESIIDRADITSSLTARIGASGIRARLDQLSLRTLGGDGVTGDVALELPLVDAGRKAARGDLTVVKQTGAGALASVASSMNLQISGDVAMENDHLSVKSFSAELRDAARDRVLISARTSAFSVDLTTFALVRTAPGTTIGHVTVGTWPLDTLAPLLDQPGLSGELSGGTLELTAGAGNLRVHANEPIRFSNVGFRRGNETIIDRLSFDVAPELMYTSLLDWKFTSQPIVCRSTGGFSLATLEAQATALGLSGAKGAVTFDVDLPAMASQPFLSGAKSLSAGRASGELRVALDAQGIQAEARATLNGLVAHDSAVKLPVANLSLRAVSHPDGRVSLDVPLLLDRLGQRSEIRIAADATKTTDGYSLDGRVTGDRVDLPDVLGVLALLGAPVASIDAEPASAPATPTAPPAADVKPFWSGLGGQLVLDIKSLSNGPDWAVSGIGGQVQIKPAELSLREVRGTINQSSAFTAGGHVRFQSGPRPYQVGAEFSLAEFDLGAFLKSFDPERPPAIDGLFAVAGNFAGTGSTFGDALEQSRGRFQMSGGKGIFRGLKRASEKVSVASKAVELGAALGSLFGSSKVKEAAEKVAGQSYQVDQLAQALGEFPFDQLVLRTVRDESLDVRIEELSLISPEVRMVGTGLVTYAAGTPILDQRLNLTYAISARGKIEKLLEKLKVLDGGKDELGYSTTREKGVIVGTLAKPDASSYFLKLAESKFTDFLVPD